MSEVDDLVPVSPLPQGGVEDDDRIKRTRSWSADQSADYVAAFAYSAYAAVEITAPHADDDIVAGVFQPLDFFDAQHVPARGMTLGVNGEFSFALAGVYVVNVLGSVAHNSINAGRTFKVRVFNITLGVPLATNQVVIPTGRNADDTLVPITAMSNVESAIATDTFRVEYGDATGASYTGVNWTSASLGFWNVGEFRGVLGQVI